MMINLKNVINKYWQNLLYDPREFALKVNIVAIGGGSGLSTLLRGLKEYTKNITAIVTMCDQGGSTGRLIDDFDILPPGDIRQCIAALSDAEPSLKSIFEYRFSEGEGLSGHALGNLLITALVRLTGSFEKAVEEACRILSTNGQVLPSTLEKAILCAKLKSGQIIYGESEIPIAAHTDPVMKVFLDPHTIGVYPKVVEAINKADMIIIGPGSLYTSIIPNFLIRELLDAVVGSSALKIYICNVSTERGETEGYSVEDHIKSLVAHSHPHIFDIVLINDKIILESHGEGGFGLIKNITALEENILGYPIFKADIISEENPLFHDSKKLSNRIKDFIKRKEPYAGGKRSRF